MDKVAVKILLENSESAILEKKHLLIVNEAIWSKRKSELPKGSGRSKLTEIFEGNKSHTDELITQGKVKTIKDLIGAYNSANEALKKLLG